MIKIFRRKIEYFFIIIFCIGMLGCISTSMMNAINSHYYKYSFAIRERNTRKTPATFSNNIFSINFTPKFIRVDYNITNLSGRLIRIDWDKAYLVVQNDSSKVITQDIEPRYADETPKPLEIAAEQSFQGNITPIDYIKNSDSGWIVTEFYPSHDDSLAPKTDWIMGLIGVDIFKLYIPVIANGETKIYKFTFYPDELEKSPVSQVPKK
ncbi:MAG: hypothetical protein PW786_09935 [Arachidicoccus sp.]|nr:hypothetical protein [Arachidicoccus sp.]